MNRNENNLRSPGPHRRTNRDRALTYGFVASIIGLPSGLYLGLPVVWGLAIFGILTGGTKIVMRSSRT
jgi:hypothetical protein